MIEASNNVIPINMVNTMTQTTLDSNIHYTRSQPESALSRLAKVAAMVMRQKTLVEWDLTKGQFDQDPASMPNSLAAKFQIHTSEANGRSVWRIRDTLLNKFQI